MPFSTIYAKGAQNFYASVSNGFLNFTYEVIDNYNPDTSTGDSTTQYSYYFPADAVSFRLLVNVTSGQNMLFELSYQNEQITFASGEYYDISNSVMLDISGVYSIITTALGI